MEIKNNLFSIGYENNFPVWDIVRYDFFKSLNYSTDALERLNTKSSKKGIEYFYLIKKILKFILIFPFEKCDLIFFTSSRNSYKNKFIDQAAYGLINATKKDYLIFDLLLKKNFAYKNHFDFSNILLKLLLPQKKYEIEYQTISSVISDNFGDNKITYEQFENVLNLYFVQYKFYSFIFKVKRPKKIFISTGNPKALIKAARNENIETFLIQHASIEIDEIDYSYPPQIEFNSKNILFADTILTLGFYWCKNVNAPIKSKFIIGNDFFCTNSNSNSDNSILFISTIVHGEELSKLALDFVNKYPGYKINFKLHPNEFHLKSKYEFKFNRVKNIRIITDEIDILTLIDLSSTVVLITSAVLYNALERVKKVAIYKKMNYEKQELIKDFEKLNFINDEDDLINVITRPNIYNKSDKYFVQNNEKLIFDLVNF